MTSSPQSLDISNQDTPPTPPRTQFSDGGAVQGTQAAEQATPGALLGQSPSVGPGTHPENKNTPDTAPMVPESTASDPLQAGDDTSPKGGDGEGQVPDSPPQPPPPPTTENADSAGSQVDDKNKEKVEDKGSTSTTNTRTPTSRSSRRKADKSSTSEGAPSSLTVNANSVAANGNPKGSTASRRKPSFIGKLIRKLVPCIPSSSRVHELDVDGETPLAVKEKAAVKGDAQPEPAVKLQDAIDVEPSSPNDLPLGAMPLTVAPLPPPPKPDTELIVQPTSQLLPGPETAGMTSGAVQPPGSTGDGVHSTHHPHGRNRPVDAVDGDESDGSSFTEDEDAEERHHTDAAEDDEDMLVENGGAGIPIGPDGLPRPLLPPVAAHHGGRKCLVLDLDETLVHSSFKVFSQFIDMPGIYLTLFSPSNKQIMLCRSKSNITGTMCT
jgi:RNA polymerase II subunit A small phosphatase-like protein